MNALQAYTFEAKQVRTVVRDEEPWFVGTDVCAALDLKNSRQVLSRLDDDERDCVQIVDAIGRDRMTTIISEAGVYRLIFTSRTPAAERFKRWLAHEVLPALRRTGTYSVGQPPSAPATVDLVEVERLNAYSRLVAEARHIYGRVQAKALWERLPLPQVHTREEGALYDLPDEDGPGCLGHLLRFALDTGSSVRVQVQRAWSDPTVRGWLQARGLKPVPGRGRDYLAVAEHHPALKKLFEETPWAEDWYLPLLSLDGARASRAPLDFGGVKSRAVMIPKSIVNMQ
ncbi:prophage antirepressor-like protein [Microvirga flocculans]|uniref:Prophage antirepressor-like protein n=1 Tax=Microvirga flocculans TaxID=217168 RepID=A0A7W6NA08_9HYPH|nr:Bro-N domain-containing protein [Microvirga flocculans]MBB4042003.1 prophage antirepressor-like protein [Microvirga flocculans]